jgi:hypothetical protein
MKGTIMPSTGLFGPHALDSKNIEAHVGAAIGAYALGYVNDQGTFIVKYVGRSDTDLNKRLKDWVGSYNSFKYGHFNSTKDAFAKECSMFHDFGGIGPLENSIHPARPSGARHACPHSSCTVLD